MTQARCSEQAESDSLITNMKHLAREFQCMRALIVFQQKVSSSGACISRSARTLSIFALTLAPRSTVPLHMCMHMHLRGLLRASKTNCTLRTFPQQSCLRVCALTTRGHDGPCLGPWRPRATSSRSASTISTQSLSTEAIGACQPRACFALAALPRSSNPPPVELRLGRSAEASVGR